MNIIVDFDTRQVERRIMSNIERAQILLDEQVAADSNEYAPEDKGTLKDSVYLGSKMGSGLLVWEDPKARRLYHGIDFNFSKDKNPNAQAKWFEAAKYKRLDAWRRIVNEEYNR
jgi:hypothetical protein